VIESGGFHAIPSSLVVLRPVTSYGGSKGEASMDVAIGVDAHKATLAAAAVDGLGRVVDEAVFGNDAAGNKRFVAWALSHAGTRRIGIEGSGSNGAGWQGRCWHPARASARCQHRSPAESVGGGPPTASPTRSMWLPSSVSSPGTSPSARLQGAVAG
jgi:hypothetical protein